MKFGCKTHLPIRVCSDKKQTRSAHCTSASVTRVSCFLSLLSCNKNMTLGISKDSPWLKTRLNTWQDIRGNWGKNWQNRQGGTWYDRKSSNSKLPRSVQPTGHSHGGVHNENMDDNSYNELIPVVLELRKISKWELLIFGTNSSIHQFSVDNITSHINKNSI